MLSLSQKFCRYLWAEEEGILERASLSCFLSHQSAADIGQIQELQLQLEEAKKEKQKLREQVCAQSRHAVGDGRITRSSAPLQSCAKCTEKVPVEKQLHTLLSQLPVPAPYTDGPMHQSVLAPPSSLPL